MARAYQTRELLVTKSLYGGDNCCWAKWDDQEERLCWDESGRPFEAVAEPFDFLAYHILGL
jgi:hypothetical protein